MSALRESICVSISLIRFRTVTEESLIQIEKGHFPEATEEQIRREINLLVDQLILIRSGNALFLPYRPDEPVDPRHTQTLSQYLDAARPVGVSPLRVFLAACFGVWAWKLWLTLALLLAAVAGCVGIANAGDGRWVPVIASAYCPCALCCDVRTERTADGTNTDRVPYGVAASPNLPLGTTIWIPTGIGYLDRTYPRDSQRLFRVDDRGGALRSDWRRSGITRLDLRFRDHRDAQKFGRKLVLVWISRG